MITRSSSHCVTVATVGRRLLLALAVVSTGCATDPQTAKLAYVKSGDGYVAEQKYSEAVIQFRNAIQKDPRDGDARLKLAEAYMKAGDVPNAHREYLRAADLLPDRADVQLKAGSFQLLFGQFEDAKTRASQILAKNPKSVDGQILLGNALAGLKDLDGAVKEIEEAIRIDPADNRAYGSLGALQIARGNRVEAEAALRRAVELAPTTAAPYLALANYYWSVEDRTSADGWLRKALEVDSHDLMANRTMGLFLLSSNRGSEAEPYLKAVADIAKTGASKLALADYYVLTQRPDQASSILTQLSGDKNVGNTAKLKLSAIEYGRKDQAAAHHELNQVLEADPQNAQALLLKARYLMAEQKIEEALAASEAAVKADERSADAQYLRGLILAAKNDTASATAAFQETLKLNPRAAAAQAQLARLYLAQGETATSRQFAEDAARNDPRNVETRLLLVRALLAEGSMARAETELKALTADNADSSSVQANMGTLMLMKRDPAEARRYFQRGLELNPKSVEALNGLVALDVAAKDVTSARDRVDAALKVSPRDTTLLLLAGRTYAAAGDLTKTEELFRQALDADPSNLLAYQLLGSLYLSQKKLDEARREFETLATHQPQSVTAATMTAMILEAQNRQSDAKSRYQEILQKDPSAAVAANNLAWIMAESSENIDMALQLAQTAKAKLAARPEVSDTLGWIYYKKNMLPQAITALREGVDRDPKNAVFHYHLGLAYAKSGDKAKAKTALTQALKLKNDFQGAEEARQILPTL